MKQALIFLQLLCAFRINAQQVPRSLYADSTPGWIKVYYWKGAKKSLQIDHRNYSIAQLSICDSFANWMQMSYLPKGSIADVKKNVSEKLTAYNQNTRSMPQAYGAYTKLYLSLKRGADGKLVPFENDNYVWNIMANGKIGDEIQLISTPEQYYFYIPAFGVADEKAEFSLLAKKNLDVSLHPQLKKYIAYFQPNGIGTSHRMVVILSKNNQLPYVQISKGEYIDQMNAAVERKFTEDKNYAIKGWPEGKVRNEMIKLAEEKYQKRLAILKNQKAKYKDRMNEKASIFTNQPSPYLEQYEDLFEGNELLNIRKVPVYKYDPVKLDASKKDHPQWIAIFWEIIPNYNIERTSNNYQYWALRNMHESILQKFNFDYVYNFFFDYEKVKGKPYLPVKIQ